MKPGPADKARISAPSGARWMPEYDAARKRRFQLRHIDESFPFGGHDESLDSRGFGLALGSELGPVLIRAEKLLDLGQLRLAGFDRSAKFGDVILDITELFV